MTATNDNNFRRVHFIGLKGVGMSALALVAKGRGMSVTGSDTDEVFITDAPLAAAGLNALVGFSADNITDDLDLVVVGAAYGDDNPEVEAAHAKNLTVWTYSEFLGFLSAGQKTIAVAGTHGKTTTTALLTYLLYHAGLKPSFVIGTGAVDGLPAHGAAADGPYFVTEADDYKRSPADPTAKFLDLKPYAAIIGSIEHDHPDLYPTLGDVIEAFRRFGQLVSGDGFLVVNGDDRNIESILPDLAGRRITSYGFGDNCDYRIELDNEQTDKAVKFTLVSEAGQHGPFQLALYGRHNAYNAAAATVTALTLGLSEDIIKKLLPSARAVERRYQLVGQVGDRIVIDDYAHHPTSVALTLAAARAQYGQRPIWCIFQAHTYSRTEALLNEFGRAFNEADKVIVTDIFSSAREMQGEITSQDLAEEISRHHKDVIYEPKDRLLPYVTDNLPLSAVLITMGAGDIYKVGHSYVKELNENL